MALPFRRWPLHLDRVLEKGLSRVYPARLRWSFPVNAKWSDYAGASVELEALQPSTILAVPTPRDVF